jgi:hypothetical protein
MSSLSGCELNQRPRNVALYHSAAVSSFLIVIIEVPVHVRVNADFHVK